MLHHRVSDEEAAEMMQIVSPTYGSRELSDEIPRSRQQIHEVPARAVYQIISGGIMAEQFMPEPCDQSP